MDRRALLQWMVATGGLAAFSRLSARDLVEIGEGAHRSASAAAHATGMLSPDEVRAVAAAAECIIPRTDTPGATDAGVAAFVDVMLADWYPVDDAARFRAGLATLDTTSRARFARPFADLPTGQQVELVAALDDDVSVLRRSAAAGSRRMRCSAGASRVR